MNNLDVHGKMIDYELNTLHGVNSTRSQSVKFNVMSHDRSECLSMASVLVIDDIPVDIPLVDMTKYPHLEGLPTHADVVVDVLIGQDHAAALRPLDIRSGKKDKPFATLTLLGWCLNGPVRADTINRRIITNFISTTKKYCDVNKLWNIEDEGVDSKQITCSQSDKKPSSLWDERHCVEHEHVMSSIPWKQVDDPFPNINMLAASRLLPPIMSQEMKNEHSIYDTKVKPFTKNGYSEHVSDISVQSQHILWCFLLHCISKKTGKLRLLFDCASRYKGSSLIDGCHQEPDRSKTLSSICFGFREHHYIVPGDIEGMYKQMLVHLEDKDILRLLWFNGENLAHHCVNVPFFGGVWSSSTAIYEFKKPLSLQIVDKSTDCAINNLMYDHLLSYKSSEDVINIFRSIKSYLKSFSFNLRMCMSANK